MMADSAADSGWSCRVVAIGGRKRTTQAPLASPATAAGRLACPGSSRFARSPLSCQASRAHPASRVCAASMLSDSSRTLGARESVPDLWLARTRPDAPGERRYPMRRVADLLPESVVNEDGPLQMPHDVAVTRTGAMAVRHNPT